jgi:hypothetical protein
MTLPSTLYHLPSTLYPLPCTLHPVPFTLYPLHITLLRIFSSMLSRICVCAIVYMYVCVLPSCAIVYVGMLVCFVVYYSRCCVLITLSRIFDYI